MLRLPKFKYLAPKSIAEAVNLKNEFGDTAMYTAGGTDLLPNMKRLQCNPQILIGLKNVKELRGINFDSGLNLGAGISLYELSENDEICKKYPALTKAASLVSSPQLRNMGTIGGNLCLDTRCNYYNQTFQWRKALGFCMKKDGRICWVALSSPKCLAVSSSDCAPVIIALDGEISLLGPVGERKISAADFYKNDGIFFLNKQPDELLVSISLPPRDGWLMNYKKLRRRNSIDFPVLGLALALFLEENGVCSGARIVIGGIESSPIRVFDAEEKLIGEKLSPERIELVAQITSRVAKPVDNTDMQLGYRKKIIKQFFKKSIKELI